MQLKPGDKIKDNDPRMYSGKRVLTITQTASDQHGRQTYVWCDKTRIRADRIHRDGKPRRSGFDLVTP